MQPIKGAQDEGVVGFLKGVGKGVGGVVLKPAAGMQLLTCMTNFMNTVRYTSLGACGVPAYAFMGLYKELQKLQDPNVQNYIAAARVAQGDYEWKVSTETERLDIVSRWHIAS